MEGMELWAWGMFVKICGSVSGCFEFGGPKFASWAGKALLSFRMIHADVPASSADTLANDLGDSLAARWNVGSIGFASFSSSVKDLCERWISMEGLYTANVLERSACWWQVDHNVCSARVGSKNSHLADAYQRRH
jgi:hypothetical protein